MFEISIVVVPNVEFLLDQGFVLNRYNPCVANKNINGHQCTICWYVDDLKISHINSDVVTDIIKTFEMRFGEMKVKRGKKHTFIGFKEKLSCKVESLRKWK